MDGFQVRPVANPGRNVRPLHWVGLEPPEILGLYQSTLIFLEKELSVVLLQSLTMSDWCQDMLY